MAVAVAQQVAWALLGALKAGASRSQAAVEGTVNLTFGLVIVSAKAALGH
ncbi:Integral membrane protein [Streptomyces venezuelae]|nr:Integral membrane protein [Streptomyces venezuelae]